MVELPDELVVPASDAAQRVRVSAEEFRSTVQDNIGTEAEWCLIDRCCESVIHHDDGADRMRGPRQPLDVDDLDGRVGGRFQIYHPAALSDHGLHLLEVSGIAEPHVDPKWRQRSEERR